MGRGSSYTSRSSGLLRGGPCQKGVVDFSFLLEVALKTDIPAVFPRGGETDVEGTEVVGTEMASGDDIIGLSRSPDRIIPSA